MPKGVGYGTMEKEVKMGNGGFEVNSSADAKTKAPAIRKYSGKGKRK